MKVVLRADVVIEADEIIFLKRGEKLRLLTPQETSGLFLLARNERQNEICFRGVYALAPEISSEDHLKRKADRKKRSKVLITGLTGMESEKAAQNETFLKTRDVRFLRDSPLPPDPLLLDFKLEKKGSLCKNCSESLGDNLNNICDGCIVESVETHLPALDAIVQGNLKSEYDEYIGNLVFSNKRANWLKLKKEKDSEKRQKMMQSIKRHCQSAFFHQKTWEKIYTLDIPQNEIIAFYSISSEDTIRDRLTKELQIRYKAEFEFEFTSPSYGFVTYKDNESVSQLYFYSVLALEAILRIVYDFLGISDRSKLNDHGTWLETVKQCTLNRYWNWKLANADEQEEKEEEEVKEEEAEEEEEEEEEQGEEEVIVEEEKEKKGKSGRKRRSRRRRRRRRSRRSAVPDVLLRVIK